MVSVKLARYWSPEEEMFPPGTVVEVDEDVAAYLERCGALAHDDDKQKAEAAPPVKPPEESPAPAPDEVAEDVATVKRPANAASVDAWRKYAESLGIVTKGLSKKELIAATR